MSGNKKPNKNAADTVDARPDCYIYASSFFKELCLSAGAEPQPINNSHSCETYSRGSPAPHRPGDRQLGPVARISYSSAHYWSSFLITDSGLFRPLHMKAITAEKLCPICQRQFRRSHRANRFRAGRL